MVEIINKPVNLHMKPNHLIYYLYLLDNNAKSIGKNIQIEVIQKNWQLPDYLLGIKSLFSRCDNNIIIKYDEVLLGLIKENKFSQIAILEYNLALSCGIIKPLQFVKLKKFEEEYIGLPLVTNELLINKSTLDIDEQNGLIQINIKGFVRTT